MGILLLYLFMVRTLSGGDNKELAQEDMAGARLELSGQDDSQPRF